MVFVKFLRILGGKKIYSLYGPNILYGHINSILSYKYHHVNLLKRVIHSHCKSCSKALWLTWKISLCVYLLEPLGSCDCN